MTESEAQDAEPILELDGVEKTFGELQALDSVTLEIAPGEIHSIIGPNGAGKTTLFNIITGKHEQTAGDIRFDGSLINDYSMPERSQLGITRSYQVNNLFLEETVFENIRLAVQTAELGLFGGKIFGNGREYKREQAAELVDVLGLTEERDTQASNLSHGHQRLLGIGIAVGTDPDLLLLDEPTSGMSAESTMETKRLIEDLHQRTGKTFLLIEHDLDVVLDVSDRITVLDRGTPVVTGPPSTVQANEQVQDVYLGDNRHAEVN